VLFKNFRLISKHFFFRKTFWNTIQI
jgi:hypothetical protein